MTEISGGLPPKDPQLTPREEVRRYLFGVSNAASYLDTPSAEYIPKSTVLRNDPYPHVDIKDLGNGGITVYQDRADANPKETEGEREARLSRQALLRQTGIERGRAVDRLALSMIPAKNLMVPRGDNFIYPPDQIEEILGRPDVKKAIRSLHVLFDPLIAQGLVALSETDFRDFLNLAESGFPSALVSEEEMRRVKGIDIIDPDFSFETEGPFGKKPDSEIPARYVFMERYTKTHDLQQAINSLNATYPNEQAPSA